MPVWSTATSGSNNPLTLSGTAASEGGLSLSANGAYLVLAGYDTAAGGNTQNNSTVGLVNANGTVNTSTTTVTAEREQHPQRRVRRWIERLDRGATTGSCTNRRGPAWVGHSLTTAPNGREVEVAPAAVSPTSRQPALRLDEQGKSRRSKFLAGPAHHHRRDEIPSSTG